MKKVLFLLPVLIFLAYTAFASASTRASGVLCEYLTASTCQACPAVSAYLDDIYSSHSYPFYYISFVTDKNEEAEKLSHEYNVFGYPTAFFNGGYRVIFGKHEKEEYVNAIKSCMERNGKINLKINAHWEKDGLRIYANITNNYDSYNGKLKIYVVEPVSRWKDYAGNKFHYAFIGYAMNKGISLNKGRHSYETIWKQNMTENIMIIGAIFNSNEETRYSDPPYNNHPFKAHFVDAVSAIKPKRNMPPRIKLVEKPENITGYRNVSFKWLAEDEHGIVYFSYRLNDAQWNEWSNFTSANFSNLKDGLYTFMLRAKDDLGQISEITYTFRVDTSPPHIVYTYPKNNQIGFKPYERIIIKFSHNMDKKSLKIKFLPATDYYAVWKNQKEVYIFASLKYETKYILTIDGRRDSGQKMKPYTIAFQTSPPDVTPPYVISASPYYNEYNNGITIKFSKRMNRDIFKGIKITPYVRYTYSWKSNDTVLVIKLLSLHTGNYSVYLTQYMQDKYGNHLKPFHFEFHITRPHILYNTGEDQVLLRNEPIEIKFSQDMDKESVERGIKITPKCEFSVKWIDNRSIKIAGEWKEKKYHVEMRNITDARGISMKNYSFDFYTWEIKSYHGVRRMPSFLLTTLLMVFMVIIWWRKK